MYYFTSKEMEKLDQLAIESGLEIRQMMELAGWHMVEVFKRLKINRNMDVVVVVGKGNKGGDGLCAARHLINNGFKVRIVLIADKLKPDPGHHLRLLMGMGVKTSPDPEEAEVIIDALIGYQLKGSPRGKFAEAVEWINNSGARVIAFDMPTGIDASSGECFWPSIKAEATLTLAAPKRLFQVKEAKERSGRVFVGDIGIPKSLYDRMAAGSRPEFEKGVNGLLEI